MTNEVYVADGYGNRRVIVLDGETLRVQADVGRVRQQAETTCDLGPYNPDAPPAQQFRLPHNISISRDGFVYVADRPNNRIQVFRKDGTYVKEVVHLEADAAAGRGVRLCALHRSAAAVPLHDRRREPSRVDPESEHAAGDRAIRPAGSVGRVRSMCRTRLRWTAAATSTSARTSTRAGSSASSTRGSGSLRRTRFHARPSCSS